MVARRSRIVPVARPRRVARPLSPSAKHCRSRRACQDQLGARLRQRAERVRFRGPVATRPLLRTAGSSLLPKAPCLQALAPSARGTHPAFPHGGRPDPSKRPRKEHPVRRAALFPILLLMLLAAVDAGAQGLDLRIGGFLPRTRDCGIPSNQPAEYTLFQDVCELYAVGRERLRRRLRRDRVQPRGHEERRGGDPPRRLLEDRRHVLPRLRAARQRRQHLPDAAAAHGAARRVAALRAHQQARQDRSVRGRRRRRGLLPVRGVRRLHRLLRSGPPDLRRSLHRRRGRLRRARLRRDPRLREPRLRDRGRGALHVVGHRHGRRLLAQRARPREPHRPVRLDLDGWACMCGSDARGARGAGMPRPG